MLDSSLLSAIYPGLNFMLWVAFSENIFAISDIVFAIGQNITWYHGSRRPPMGEQVALLTKRASGKIWVMRRLKNLGLDGKKTISGFFLRLRGDQTLRWSSCLRKHIKKIGNVEKEWRELVCRTRIWTIGYGLFGPFMICICVNSLSSTYPILIHTKS